MKKEEATTKKTEAKEEGAASKHLRVVFSPDKGKRKIFLYSGAALIAVIICAVFLYFKLRPRVSRFMLDDLYIDPLSNSSLLATISSKNPNPNSSAYYRNMSVHVLVGREFETERVFLQSTLQQPHEITTWTAVVATNSDSAKPNGSFQIRNGVTNGDVIAEFLFQWKCGICSTAKYNLRVTCPVLLKLKDLTSAVPKPMSRCSHHYIS